jgi:hypothetical protein
MDSNRQFKNTHHDSKMSADCIINVMLSRNGKCRCPESHYAKCVMLNSIIPNVAILSVVLLRAMAPGFN